MPGPNNVLIIMGSARAAGNTASAAQRLRDTLRSPVQLIDLSVREIGKFEYSRFDDRDDFRSIVQLMTASEHIVFATPVYWYAMSSVMKTFFDRFTDLLIDRQHRIAGRALAGRNVWLIATGTDPDMPSGFTEPFSRTAEYFGMEWRGAAYCQSIKGAPLSTEGLAPAAQLAHQIGLS
jgi:multimeric flavodoxin WrbA